MLTSKTYSIRWSFSSYEPPFGEPLETAEFLNVVPGNLHDVGVRQSVHGIVANGTGQLHRLTGFLRFQPGVHVQRHVRFGQVFSVQTAARDGVRHVGAELPVGRAGVDVGSAGPVADGIDEGGRIRFEDVFGLRVALADHEPGAVQNVFAVAGVGIVENAGDFREFALFVVHGDTFEDAVVSAAESFGLILRKMRVLRNFDVVDAEVSGDALRDGQDFRVIEVNGSLRNDVARAVTDENLNGDFRVFFFFIREIDESAGDAVGDFVGVRGIDFFKHNFSSFPCSKQTFHYALLL